jgi:hypothetical protein
MTYADSERGEEKVVCYLLATFKSKGLAVPIWFPIRCDSIACVMTRYARMLALEFSTTILRSEAVAVGPDEMAHLGLVKDWTYYRPQAGSARDD